MELQEGFLRAVTQRNSLKWKWILSVTSYAGRVFRVVSSDCEVMFVFLWGVDRTLRLHQRHSPLGRLCSCIMASLITPWNSKHHKQSRPVFFFFFWSCFCPLKGKAKHGLPFFYFYFLHRFKQKYSRLLVLLRICCSRAGYASWLSTELPITAYVFVSTPNHHRECLHI